MKTLFNVLAIVFLVLGVTFTILPLGTIALLPVGLAIIFATIALFVTKKGTKNMSKALLVIGLTLALAVIIKNVAVKESVAPPSVDDIEKREQVDQENIDLLEELDSLLDELEDE